jgi:hypothetical protein
LISLIILAEEYKLWSSSLCSFPQPPVTSSLFGCCSSSWAKCKSRNHLYKEDGSQQRCSNEIATETSHSKRQ